jgi:hypothetical protein
LTSINSRSGKLTSGSIVSPYTISVSGIRSNVFCRDKAVTRALAGRATKEEALFRQATGGAATDRFDSPDHRSGKEVNSAAPQRPGLGYASSLVYPQSPSSPLKYQQAAVVLIDNQPEQGAP